MKREYDEFKVRINSLPESIRRRSDAYNAHDELLARKKMEENGGNLSDVKFVRATWMSDGSHWPGTWLSAEPDHSRGDHAGIIQVGSFPFLLIIIPLCHRLTVFSCYAEPVVDVKCTL